MEVDDFPRGPEPDSIVDHQDDSTPKPLKKKQKREQKIQRRSYVAHSGQNFELSKPRSPAVKCLGMIIEVSESHLRVSLPHGMEESIPAEEASDVIAAMIENTKEAQILKEMHGDPYPLTDLFALGQYIRGTYFLSASDDIQFSLKLSRFYDAVCLSRMPEGALVTGCVRTLEDHGYSMIFGIQGISGFLNKSELHKYYGENVVLRPGQMIDCVIKLNSANGVIQLSVDPESIRNSMNIEGQSIDEQIVLPGALIHAEIREIKDNGLVLSFMRNLKGIVSLFHLAQEEVVDGWQATYCLQQVVKARVICWNPDKSEYLLSLKPHLLNVQLPLMPAVIGQVFEDAVISRADPIGLSLRLSTDSGLLAAYVFQDSLSDLPVQSRDFKLRQRVSVRVTGFQAFDGLIVGSMKESVIRSGIVCLDDIYPGRVAEGSIKRVNTAFVIVSIGEGIEGIARQCGISGNIPLQRVYNEGQLVSYRVLRVKPEVRQVLLTLDTHLVHASLPFLTSWDEAEIGARVIGYVLAIKAKVIIVAFAGDVHGILPADNIKLNEGETLASCFQKNQIIKPWIRHYYGKKHKIILTLIKTQLLQQTTTQSNNPLQPYIELCKPPEALSVGDIAQAVIEKVLDRKQGFLVNFVVHHSSVKGKAIIALHQIADHPLSRTSFLKHAKCGTLLGDVVILEANSIVTASRKASLVKHAAILPQQLVDVKENMLIHGTVSFVGKDYVSVSFLNGLTGRAFRNQLPMPSLSPSKQFSTGQSVFVRVIKVDSNRRRIQLTINPSRITSTAVEFLHDAFSEMKTLDPIPSELTREKIGSVIDITIVEVNSNGARCRASSVEGFIPAHQFSEEWPEEGISVQRACLLDVSTNGTPFFSLKSYLIQRGFEYVKKGKRKRKRQSQIQQLHTAVVELIQEYYAIVSLPEDDYTLALVPLSDYNLQSFSLSQAIRNGDHIAVEQPPKGEYSDFGCRVVCTQLQALLWKLDSVRRDQVVSRMTEVGRSGHDGHFQVEDIVVGVVDSVIELGIAVKLTAGPVPAETRIMIPFIDAFDYFTDQIATAVHPGQKIRGVIVKCSAKNIALSTRESEGGSIDADVQLTDIPCPIFLENTPIERGVELYGYVSGYSQKKDALFINISRDLSAAVHPPHLADDPVVDVPLQFPLGTLVKGVVVSFNYPKVGLSLRSGNKPLASPGRVMTGIVANILPQGVYVVLEEIGMQGLVPRYDMQNKQIKSFQKGQPITVRVNPLTDAYHLLLNIAEDIKEMRADETSDGGSVVDDEEAVREVTDFEKALATAVQKGREDESRLSPSNNDAPNWQSEIQFIDRRKIWGEVRTDAQTQSITGESNKATEPEVKHEPESNPSSEPQTTDDFERLLLSQPNSSYLWLRYMAMFLEAGNVARARATAERALDTIEFRKENDRLNIWLARLNLERTQEATTEVIMSLFQQAILCNDPKKLHLAFLSILESSQQTQIGDLVVKSMHRRCPTSAKVYIQAMHYWLSTGRGGNFKKTFDMAFRNLPKRKHIKVALQSGIMEFKMGKVERGRDIFETLVSCYPKRMDLWNVYLDQEMVQNDIEHIRSLLERVSAIDGGRKKMKRIFKRYLQFEIQHGSSQTVEHVKNKAREYVAQKNNQAESAST